MPAFGTNSPTLVSPTYCQLVFAYCFKIEAKILELKEQFRNSTISLEEYVSVMSTHTDVYILLLVHFFILTF